MSGDAARKPGASTTASTTELPLAEADALATALVAHLRGARGLVRVEVAGSVRRRCSAIRELAIVAAVARRNDVAETFVAYRGFATILAHTEAHCAGELRRGLRVDLWLVPPDAFGAALGYYTASKSHLAALGVLARKHRLTLDAQGVYRAHHRVAGATEGSVFQCVGLPFIEPELRENRGELEAARAGTLPELVGLSALRGDLHLRATSLDGHSTLDELVATAKMLGHEYIAVADRARLANGARGLDRLALLEQKRAIGRINDRGDGPVVLWGAEVEILPDGTLDLDAATRAELDLVVATIHPDPAMSRSALTARVVDAMRQPRVHVVNARGLGALDVDRVIRAAVETGVLLGLDARPDRASLGDLSVREARDAGVGFVIGSAARHGHELRDLRYGVDRARRGWCEARHVANTLSLRGLRARLPQ